MNMEATEIIDYLRSHDLTVIVADDDNLEIFPADKITHELIERLRKHKPAIIEELKREKNQKIEIIRAWLHRIGEPPEDHHIVLSKCRNDPEGAFAYFSRHASGEFE